MLASIRAFFWRLAHLTRRSKSQVTLDAELEFHLQMETKENLRNGMSPEQAKRAALLALGGIEQTKEAYRETTSIRWLDVLCQDMRYGLRILRKNPGFTLAASLLIALGIGINTTVFSIVDVVLFRPLPVSAPEELAYLYPSQSNALFSYDSYLMFQENNPAFVEMLAHAPVSAKFTANGETTQLIGELVTSNYFSMLGIEPLIGRGFIGKGAEANDQTEIVIGHDLCNRLFANTNDAIGKAITLNGGQFTIIGVARAGFKGISAPWSPTQFWIPIASWAKLMGYPLNQCPAYPIGRLKPGETIKEAQAITATLFVTRNPTSKASSLLLLPSSRLRLPFDRTGAIVPAKLAAALLIVTGIVLLTAIANLAGVLMARGVSRKREIAARLALGAPRWRIVQQLLTESVLLVLLGGAFAMGLARLLIGLYVANTPARFSARQVFLDVSMDVRVFFFTFLLCIVTGILVGLGPARRASRIDLMREISGGTASPSAHERSSLRYWIVIPQISSSLVLLLMAAGFIAVLLRSEFADPGYTSNNLTVVDLSISDALVSSIPVRRGGEIPPEDQSRLTCQRILTSMQSLRSVDSFCLTTRSPFLSGMRRSTIIDKDQFLAGNSQGFSIDETSVSSQYFRITGIHSLRGRYFEDRDMNSSPPVAIVSESLGRALWPGQNPVGKYIASFNPLSKQSSGKWFEVIGVVRDVRPALSEGGPNPIAYFAFDQNPLPFVSLIVRGQENPLVIDRQVKKTISSAGVNVEIKNIASMRDAVGELLYPRRMITAILTLSALFALLLATVGIYGVISYSVAQRTKEFGIRFALGAEEITIMKLVVTEGAKVGAIGAILGIILAIAASRIASSIIMPIPVIQLTVSAVVIVAMGFIILIASYIPARRASKVDPIKALRDL